MAFEIDVAASPTTARRTPGPDVVRAVALIGVVVMNYHGYLILRGADRGDGFLDELFDPWTGPLSTRFAATFVLVAGVGVTLMTRRVTSAEDVLEMRWRFVRRGLVLYVLGQLLDRIWPGTIIVYYGAMFVLAAVLFRLRTAWIVLVGVGAAVGGAWINAWIYQQRDAGESTAWLTDPGSSSVRGLVFDLVVNGTHPLLPWLAFFCAGIVVGRLLGTPWLQPALVGLGVSLAALASIVSSAADSDFQREVLSTDPGSRSLVYTASALGTALAAYGAISWVAERWPEPVDPLRRAGQLSLTIYLAHILVFNLLVDWLEWIEPAGIGQSLVFAGAFWVVAIAAATWWHRSFGRGPAERVYRRLGG